MELLTTISLLLFSILAGGLIVQVFTRSDNQRLTKLLLAFSGGFLLSIAFIHFIPELYEESSIDTGLFILIGFLIQLILEFFSGGLEHGHVHIHKGSPIPYGVLLALGIHSFIEGIPLGSQIAGHEIATHAHHGEDNSLLLGILLHRVPVAVALMTLLISSNIGQLKSWIFLSIFATMAPFGLLLGWGLGEDVEFDFNIILAIVVGMFLHISTTIIFETSENHKFNFVKLLTILSGCALAFFIH
jgi:zinc transporter ZupT